MKISPTIGSCIRARRRHWLVEEISAETRDPDLIEVVCIDDDAQGQAQTLIPACEIDFKRVDDEAWESLGREAPSDPLAFSLFLQTLQWGTATSADQALFQAPFRAGIEISPYQLVPLAKALDLPRVNLMIADDVGLGKTIEAALVMRELMLRRRLDFFVVAAPASMTLQWKEELASKFGISAEIVDREFVADVREKRGFAYNPWNSANGYIISHTLLREPAYTDGLHAVLGALRARSMLVLDEAHHVAPSHGEAYGLDTQLTRAVRDLAARFEHRLFLTATPHNGHSNSFSALLEMLDPRRFTRGIEVGREEHEPVMVRRLKADLRELTSTPFPKRVIEPIPISDTAAGCPELQVSEKLVEFLTNAEVHHRSAIRLQQRLMSCVHSFALTLEKEMDSLGEADRTKACELAEFTKPFRVRADAKTRRLVEWVKAHMGNGATWNERRLLIFTEFADTLDWLRKQLLQLLDLSENDDRIACFTGSTSLDERAMLKSRFNSDPDTEPLRILLCTDAAREGINLQHRCYDLFHFDLPWNPSRLEQRNGRIDRRFQPMPEVFCRYFIYENRQSDRILDALVKKTERINRELGEVGPVIAETLEKRLEEKGIFGDAGKRLEADLLSEAYLEAERQKEELRLSPERERRRRKLVDELATVERRLEQSRKQKAISQDSLQGVFLNAAERVAPQGLRACDGYSSHDVFEIDTANASFRSGDWAPVFDEMMARPRKGGETEAEYKANVPVKKVSFYPIKDGERLDASVEQLHIEHRLVKRLLSQFNAQGFRSRLDRTSILQTKGSQPRCVLLGRLSLYAKGAASLHSEIVPITASINATSVAALKDEGRTAREVLRELAGAVEESVLASDRLQSVFRARAVDDAQVLRPLLHVRAEMIEASARKDLSRIAEAHAVSLRNLLEGQKSALRRELEKPEVEVQLDLGLHAPEDIEQRKQDEEHWRMRLARIDEEILSEPEAVRAMYEIVARRLEPIGLVYLLPEGFAL
ncbi:SNF2-related protein [Hyphobacterium sp. SN044]|uniref:DISARM system SNF2-like helicase DrmD n=1 Tax=Hyphobacterium sp. SN044 TaxID=2912575 RepID=UPI001F00F05E|nr:DISARM system SNF2-like helicase DrmD [Hyphobacterium sp. SN044]MCF8879658.1 SNF2-related protein [Hyphobacterium sp. SN044]